MHQYFAVTSWYILNKCTRFEWICVHSEEMFADFCVSEICTNGHGNFTRGWTYILYNLSFASFVNFSVQMEGGFGTEWHKFTSCLSLSLQSHKSAVIPMCLYWRPSFLWRLLSTVANKFSALLISFLPARRQKYSVTEWMITAIWSFCCCVFNNSIIFRGHAEFHLTFNEQVKQKRISFRTQYVVLMASNRTSWGQEWTTSLL